MLMSMPFCDVANVGGIYHPSSIIALHRIACDTSFNRWKDHQKLNPNDLLGLLCGLTGSRNSIRCRTADHNFNLNTYISARRQNSNEISQAKFMFVWSTYPKKQPEMLCDLTGSEKSKMAASKTVLTSSQLVDR